MKLYDVPAELDRLLGNYESLLEDSQGEVTEAVETAEKEIKEYCAASADKIEATIAFCEHLASDASQLKVEEERLYARRSSLEGQRERLRGVLVAVLDQSFGGKLKTSKYTASVAQSKGATKIELAPDADAGVCYKENPELFKKPVLDNPAVKVFCDRMGGTPSWLTVEDLPGKRSLRIR
jgi:hypothetical protein